jgi:hypothetical protein
MNPVTIHEKRVTKDICKNNGKFSSPDLRLTADHQKRLWQLFT